MSTNLKKVIGLGFAVLTVIAIAIAVWLYSGFRSRRGVADAKQTLDQQIEEQLQGKPTEGQVELFITRRGMTFTKSEEVAGPAHSTEAVFLIQAISPRVVHAPMIDCSLVVTFTFDDKHLLQGYSDKPICSGPF